MAKAPTQPARTESATEQVKGLVQDVTAEAKGSTSQQLREQIVSRSTQMGEQLTGTVAPLRRAADQLRSEQSETPAKLIERITDRAERLGHYLTEADSDRILRDVEAFGRRQPWVMLTGSVVAGFFASRFVKASSSRAGAMNGAAQDAGPAPAPPQAVGALEGPGVVSRVPAATGGGSAG
jgi:hypothetical protein